MGLYEKKKKKRRPKISNEVLLDSEKISAPRQIVNGFAKFCLTIRNVSASNLINDRNCIHFNIKFSENDIRKSISKLKNEITLADISYS